MCLFFAPPAPLFVVVFFAVSGGCLGSKVGLWRFHVLGVVISVSGWM